MSTAVRRECRPRRKRHIPFFARVPEQFGLSSVAIRRVPGTYVLSAVPPDSLWVTVPLRGGSVSRRISLHSRVRYRRLDGAANNAFPDHIVFHVSATPHPERRLFSRSAQLSLVVGPVIHIPIRWLRRTRCATPAPAETSLKEPETAGDIGIMSGRIVPETYSTILNHRLRRGQNQSSGIGPKERVLHGSRFATL